jgi:hypothetical protein
MRTIEEFYTDAVEHAGDTVERAREHLSGFDFPVVSSMMPNWTALIEKLARTFEFDDAESMYTFLSAWTGDSIGVVDVVMTSTVTNGIPK